MTLCLLLLIGMITFVWTRCARRQKRKNYQQKYNGQTATSIKYDKREVKGYVIALIITGVIFFISLGELMTDMSFGMTGMLGSILQFAIIFGVSIGGFLVLVFAYLLIDASLYLKRLKTYGYEVPVDKRKYERLLENLPRNREDSDLEADASKGAKHSKFLMCLCTFLSFLMVGLSLHYLHTWYFMGDDTMFLFVVLLLTDSLWVFLALLFGKQMNTQKYKNDVEIDANRKVRMNICGGLVLVVVSVGMSLVVKDTAYNMSEYVFQSRMVKDGERIMEIGQAMTIASIDPEVKEDHENYEEIMRSMEEGVDITNWGVRQGKFQEEVARMLEITDFSQLKDSFYSTDGPAIVYAKLEDGRITVQLLNVYPVAKWEVKYE